MLASLPPQQRQAILDGLTEAQAEQLAWDWHFWARPEQIAPAGDWLTWVILAGRGFGKTRSGAEWIREQVAAGKRRIALIGETQKDLEEVMIEGDSGILSVFPPGERPNYRRRPVRLEFSTGAIALGYNATEPDQLRGPQFDAAWADELAKWGYARETWDMLQFGLRLGDQPRQLVTTTPRPIPVLKEIIAAQSTVVTKGRTLDNAANLAPSFMQTISERYAGTRLGRQELEAEILDDIPGALWSRAMLDKAFVRQAPELVRIVVAVDPSGTKGLSDDGDEVGIVVAGKGIDGNAYALSDRSCKLSPDGWGRRAVEAYHQHKASRMIAERNFGGAMVEHVIRTVDKTVAYKEVTASRGKIARAEPVAALYEQGRIKHVGAFPELECQLCAMTPDGYLNDGSPDRADALVWAITELMLGNATPRAASGTFSWG